MSYRYRYARDTRRWTVLHRRVQLGLMTSLIAAGVVATHAPMDTVGWHEKRVECTITCVWAAGPIATLCAVSAAPGACYEMRLLP